MRPGDLSSTIAGRVASLRLSGKAEPPSDDWVACIMTWTVLVQDGEVLGVTNRAVADAGNMTRDTLRADLPKLAEVG